MHERIGMLFFNRMGVPAPREAHTRLYVNNAYVDRGLMEYDVIDGFWGDAGESIDVYYEVVDHVRQNGANLTLLKPELLPVAN